MKSAAIKYTLPYNVTVYFTASFENNIFLLYQKSDSSSYFIGKYNPNTNSFEEITSFVVQQSGNTYMLEGFAAGGGFLYIDFSYYTTANYLGTKTYRYSLSANTLSSSFNYINYYNGSNFAQATVDNNIYYFGGRESSGTLSLDTTRPICKSVSVRDCVTGLIRATSAKPQNYREGGRAAAIAGDIYIVGGALITDSSYDETGMLELYNPQSESFKTLAPCPLSLYPQITSNTENLFAIEKNNPAAYAVYYPQNDYWQVYNIEQISSQNTNIDFIDNRLFITCTNKIYSIDMRTLSVSGLSPASGFINSHTINRFSWDIVSFPVPTIQLSAKLQWRKQDLSLLSEIAVEGTAYIDIPQNTFPSGELEWRVQASGANGLTTEWSNFYKFTTIELPPMPPSNLTPSSGSYDATKNIVFYWIHKSPLATEQKAFEVQLAPDGVNFAPLSGKVYDKASFFQAPPNRVTSSDQAGKVGWRVRTFNSDDIPSGWSATAYFVIKTAPPAPAWISVEKNKARPICHWNATDQIGVQLQAVVGDKIIYDSFEYYSTEKTHKIKDYLNNGNYIFKVRVKSSIKLWSDWAEYPAAVSSNQLYSIRLSANPIKDGLSLRWKTE